MMMMMSLWMRSPQLLVGIAFHPLYIADNYRIDSKTLYIIMIRRSIVATVYGMLLIPDLVAVRLHSSVVEFPLDYEPHRSALDVSRIIRVTLVFGMTSFIRNSSRFGWKRGWIQVLVAGP